MDRDGSLHATATPHEARLAWSGCGAEECSGALYMTVTRDGLRWECELQDVWASRQQPDRIHVILMHPLTGPIRICPGSSSG